MKWSRFYHDNGDNHIRQDWQLYKEGKPADLTTIDPQSRIDGEKNPRTCPAPIKTIAIVSNRIIASP